MEDRLVFLGGTCGNNRWRDSFIAEAVAAGVPRASLFNPVVEEWSDAAQWVEEAAKARATEFVYYIADPQQEGLTVSAYSLVEATMALYDAPDRTVVVFDASGMSGHALKAMAQARTVLARRFPAARILASRDEALAWLVGQFATT
jgi:hypothetical protein